MAAPVTEGTAGPPAPSLRGPPSRRAITWLLVLLALHLVAAAILLPIADRQGPLVPAITPAFVVAVLVTELATSYLLFVEFNTSRAWSTLLLAAAYLYAALMAALHVVTFPAAVLPDGVLLGGAGSTAWVFVLWMCGYAVMTLAAILAEVLAPEGQVAPAQAAAFGRGTAALVLALVLVVGVLAIPLVDRLPAMIERGAWTPLNLFVTQGAMALIALGIVLNLAFAARRRPLFLWLSLAMAALLFANILSITGGGRYTVGWFSGRVSWVFSACVLFLFFMGEFGRQQRSLARARDKLEARVQERTAGLSAMVRERDLLLREVHHRVKNNLQMTDSLMDMEARRLTDAAAKEVLAALRHRIHSLGLVHQQLMSSPDLETFDIAPFLRELSANLASSFAAAERGTAIEVKADAVPVDIDFAIPIGLITTELITNALKHARARHVTVAFHRLPGGQARLEVADDGTARAEAAPPSAGIPMTGGGAGGRIVAGLTRQLGGDIQVTSRNGTHVMVTVPLPKVADHVDG